MPRINQIQVRRDTAANWTSTNPVLAAGEMGLETDTRKTKFGDGTTSWTSLAYATSAGLISSDTAPDSPSVGAQWFNSSTGKTYVYYDGYWVELDSNGTSATSTGNAIINGAFEINQRNFSSSSSAGFTFDRFFTNFSGGTVTHSVQNFTPGTAPVPGYESANFYRCVVSGQSAASNFVIFDQAIESVRTFANQTITLSFWAKANSGTPKIAFETRQRFGSGGTPSADVDLHAGQVTLTTSWVRYSLTIAVPSIAGKTIGTTNDGYLKVRFYFSAGSNFDAVTGSLGHQSNTFDIWGVQAEAGSVATPFRRNANSRQGELAACQRYTKVFNGGETDLIGFAFSTTGGQYYMKLPTTMRVSPSLAAVTAANFTVYNSGFSSGTPTAVTLNSSNPESVTLNTTTTAGSPTIAQNQPVKLIGGASAQIILSAEL
jgi:hypothetical protein